MHTTFHNNDQMLTYIAQAVVLPIWQDPTCGDGKCEWPWEFPAFGRFGCRADCGEEKNTTRIMVQIKANFAGQISPSPRILMSNARWNLCLDDPERHKRGQEELCWFVPNASRCSWRQRQEWFRFAEDQRFTEVVVLRLETMHVIVGEWTVRVKGDYARKVSGQVFDISNASNPVPIDTHVRMSFSQNEILSHFDECSHHGRDAGQKRTAHHTCLPE